ncbi:MAG: class I SAM-dependent methyltransferase [Peptoniphilaceae bacterium]|nr:class I SAM-dependent methyltransferase [Peptoniphilaceae bacterium]MDY3987297.1 class I SAM-dependent methyltransferase [Peptoniphilaceae bacterium]
MSHIPRMHPDGLAFLLEKIRKEKTKKGPIRRILEVGTAVGDSAIAMAELSQEISVDTVEKNMEMAQQALENVREHALFDRVHVYLYDAIDFFPPQDKRYDLIFVDAAKGQYGAHMEHFLPYLQEGGYFLFDNMEFHGMVAHPERTANRHTKDLLRRIRRFREQMEQDDRFEYSYYPEIGDGLLWLKRKGNQ